MLLGFVDRHDRYLWMRPIKLRGLVDDALDRVDGD
jgi:hypothetical protein